MEITIVSMRAVAKENLGRKVVEGTIAWSRLPRTCTAESAIHVATHVKASMHI